MKKKRQIPSRQDIALKKFLWILLGGITMSLGACLLFSMLPQYFAIPLELIPTAQYLQEFPEGNDFELVIRQEYEHDEYLYDVCLDMGNGELNYGDNRTGSILIDGQFPYNRGKSTQSLSVFSCAMGVYLEKGLHLIEYRSENVLFNQKWAIEIE